MTPIHLHSEPYQATGNIDALAATKAIGRPNLSQWHVFLRETIQNSWDARLGHSIQFSVDAHTPDESQGVAFRDFFALVPPDRAFQHSDALSLFLDDIEEQTVLIVSDRSTRGLGGPTRADKPVEGRTDFVDFVRNIGRDAAKTVGGGTYGFGKAILWRSSACSTVVVHSRTYVDDHFETRLMAISLTASYNEGQRRFTGRHWWGVPDPATGAEPLRGDAASDWADRLGFAPFGEEETGTSLMVLGPIAEHEGQSLQDVMESLHQAVLWWCWPHLVDRTIEVSLSIEGETVEIEDPSQHRDLKEFVNAYVRVGREEVLTWPWERTEVVGRRGLGRLGKMVWRHHPEQRSDGRWRPAEWTGSHIALTRKPRFIVKYRPVPAHPDGQLTAGVFVADDQRDEDFAASEPVAHEDWSPENMGKAKGEQNPVRIALNQIDRAVISGRSAAPARVGAENKQLGLNHLAGALGTSVGLGVDGGTRSPSGTRSRGGGGGARRQQSLQVAPGASLSSVNDTPVARFTISCRTADTAHLALRPRLCVEGGAPDPDTAPALASLMLDGREITVLRDDFVEVPSGQHEITVGVVVPASGAVTVDPRWC